MKKKIYLASPHMSDEQYELGYVNEAFDSNWIAPLGENLNCFEKELCEKVQAKAAAALSSGTAAIHLALKAAGIGKDDVVFVQSLTFSGSVNPVIYLDAKPVFIDSEYESWNLSPEALEKGFKKYPSAKGVIFVNLYGGPAKIDEITEVCRRHNAVIIEDAAESLGSTYKGKHTGSFGDFSIISFNGNKIVTSSGGGAVLSSSENAEERIGKIRFWSTQSRDPARYYQHSELGYNYRMSNVVAGIGRGQLKVLDLRKKQKQDIYNYYKEHIGTLDGVSLIPQIEGADSNRWLTVIALDKSCPVKPIDVILALENENIESRPVWKPMHLQPFFAHYDYIDNGGVAEDLFNRGVCLPSDTKMTEDDLVRVCKTVRSLWK